MARTARLGLGALLGTVALVLIGLGVWRLYWPHHRPSLRAGERYGVDVSSHQGAIDWEAVAGDDIAFAYVKATEGGDHVDARFAANRDAARAAGVEVGAYHFFTLCRPGAEQAENFLATVPADMDLPPALDLELGGNCSARPPADQVRREVRAWVDAVEATTGETVALYVLDGWEDLYPSDHLADRDRPRWHRRIGPFRPGGDWWLWQLSYEARVAGVDGPVDLNVMRRPR